MANKAVTEYMDYATMHGVARLKNSPFIILKIFWVLCLMGSFGMIIFQFILLWQKYKSNPISTSIELKSPSAVDFPVVTVCNTNPVDYFGFDYDTPLQNVVNSAEAKYAISSDAFNTSNSNSNQTFSKAPVDNDILWSTQEQFRMTLSLYGYTTLAEMSRQMDNYILLCNYNGATCTKESIVPVRTYEYGFCYNIYPELQKDRKNRLASAAGKRHGLELLLNIDQLSGVPFVTQSAGVYVMVHSQEHGETSIRLTDGIVVPNGFEADIKVSLVENVRVKGDEDSPRCNDGPITYEECMYHCQMEKILLFCGCIQDVHHFYTLDPTVDLVENGSEPENINRPCRAEYDYNCIQETLAVFAEYEPDDLECNKCRVICKETRYERELSIATWPSDSFVPIVKRILSAVYEDGYVDTTRIRDDLVMVRVFLDKLSYPSIKEEYSYSSVNFISDLGGTLGLWAGFSVLSLIELFELIVLLCSNRNRENNAVTSIQPESNGVPSGK